MGLSQLSEPRGEEMRHPECPINEEVFRGNCAGSCQRFTMFLQLTQAHKDRDGLLRALNDMMGVYAEMINQPNYHHTEDIRQKVADAVAVMALPRNKKRIKKIE